MYSWNDVPIKDVVPLFDEHAQGADRAASGRVMLKGHFHVDKVRYNCVIKTAFAAGSAIPAEEDLESIRRECAIYDRLREGTGKSNQNGCVTCLAMDPLHRYLVLEHYGRDLRALLEVKVKLPFAVVEGVAIAVAALHEQGIVHGDIKPQNILYSHSDAEGYVMKLCDLDCARPAGESCFASALGTVGYLAPELYQARQADAEIAAAIELDLFALGVVLWQVLESSTTSPLPHHALAVHYTDQNFLWGKLELNPNARTYQSALHELTQVEPHLRKSARQLCTSLQKQSQPYMHEELQRVIDENSRLLRGNAFLESGIAAQLGELRRDVGAIRHDLKAHLTEMTDMLQTLIKDTHHLPTLAVIVPEVAPRSVFQSVLHSPTRLFRHRYRLYFLCSFTHQIAHCGSGPDGGGYRITRTCDWVKQAAPVLRTGLLLLKLAALAGGLPIPVPDISPLLKDADRHGRYLSAALRLVDNPLSDHGDPIVDLKTLVDDAGNEVNGLDARTLHEVGAQTGAVLEENSVKAYNAISNLFAEMNVDVKSTCGLRKVTYKGKTAWILDNDATERQFKESLMH